MTEEEQLPRLRATRAGIKGVVTKLIAETEGIPHGPYSLEEKTRNRLARIEKVLKEKTELIHNLDKKIIAVEDIKEEIENNKDLKMRVMDAIEAISIGTTPTTPFNSSSSSNLTQGTNTIFIPPSSPGSSSSSQHQPQGNFWKRKRKSENSSNEIAENNIA